MSEQLQNVFDEDEGEAVDQGAALMIAKEKLDSAHAQVEKLKEEVAKVKERNQELNEQKEVTWKFTHPVNIRLMPEMEH